jgi:hypothetical protein
LVKCTLRNTVSGTEIALLSSSAGEVAHPYDPSGHYTVQCETSGNLNKMTYLYLDGDNEIHKDTTWTAPWLSDELTALSGQKVKLQVIGETWTAECFAEEFTLESSSGAAASSSSTAAAASCNTVSCPIYGQPKDDVTCVKSLDDCKCQYSYKLVGGHCVKDWCYHDFQCPSHKERVPGIDCYSSIRDCRFPRVAAAVRTRGA